MFTRLLLVACVCIVAALVLYFFYWNRFIAFIIRQVIRVLYWNQEASSIWVEIGSIHFSFLAGRILFKDFCYHSSNQTIKVVKGQIQWRYWIRRPTTEEEIITSRAEESKASNRSVFCRIQVSFQGFEWFLYNRTAAYDGIISQMESLNRPTSRFSERQKSRNSQASPFYPPTGKRSFRVPLTIQNAFTWLKQQLPNLDPKDLLPLGIDVTTGAIIMGNPSIPDLLVAEFHNADGTFAVVQSRSKHDLYKQVLTLKFQNALVRYVQNEDYVDPLTTIGGLLHSRIKRYNTSRTPVSYTPYRAFARLWKQVRLFDLTTKYFSDRREQRAAHNTIKSSTQGIFRKPKEVVDEDTPVGVDFSTYEYAVERKILEAPMLELTYYVDMVGEVPPLPHLEQFSRGDIIDVGNGDTAPEWGFDLIISGGFLKYGPWADRQRAELQRMFFPPSYQNVEVTPHLRPGDKRLWTALQIFVEMRDETILQIPFREASKDWQWDGKVDIPQRSRKRENASINVTVGDRSSINYIMPMVAGPTGYEPTLEVHLDTIVVTSSLNDIRLVTAESCRVRGELPSPIQWNDERTWNFSIFLRQPVLYLLRDHINMFTDLGKDWASGPPTDYQKFIPMIYTVKLQMHHYELNLYANDHNIIDKPLLKEENALVILRGPTLRNEATILSNKFRAESTYVPFLVDAPDMVVEFSLPRWNTHASHATNQSHNLLKTGSFSVEGSYRYYSEARDDHVDQLKLDLSLHNTAFKALGWSVRYFMVLRDNYFGSFTHFSTLFEYLEKRKQDLPAGDPIALKYREGKHNMLQVEMSLRVDGAMMVFPAGLLGFQTASRNPSTSGIPGEATGACLVLHVPEIQMQLRLHDYYMEMSLNLDAVRGHINLSLPEKVAYILPGTGRKEIIFIDGIDIVANRLFGPQPRTATYVCIWEIQVGKVKGSLTAIDAKILSAAGNAFRLDFVDVVNAPASVFMPPLDPDITFYKVHLAPIELAWRAGHATLVVSLDQGLKFSSNDLGAQRYRKVISLRIPHAGVKVLLASSQSKTSWLEAAEFAADAFIDLYSAPKDHPEMTKAQMTFVKEQDNLTGRVKRMLARLQQRGNGDPLKGAGERIAHLNDVYLPQPMLPNAGHEGKSHAFRKTQQPQTRDRPPTWRLSTLANISDSDGEEGISEADRDARLARSRSSVTGGLRRFDKDDDLTMSSGDESDDADLTDGDSSDSDWSNFADSPSAQEDNALLMFYSHLTRRYVENRYGAPGSWEGSQFTLSRDKARLASKGSAFHSGKEIFLDLPSVATAEEARLGCDATVVRFRAREPFCFNATPLLVTATACFEKDIQNIPSDVHMVVDSLLATYLSNNPFKNGPPACIILDLQVPLIAIQILHHVTLPEEGRSPLPNQPAKISGPTRLDSTAVLELRSEAFHLAGSFVEDEIAVEASLHQLHCNLDVSIDKRTLLTTTPHQTIVNICLSGLHVHHSPNLSSCSSEDVRFNVGHRGPEVVALSFISFSGTIREIAKHIQKLKKDRDLAVRNTISSILKLSEDKPVVDTMSTIQPSYLVQSGIPLQLRADPIFRFLFHLRNCLSAVEASMTSFSERMKDTRDLVTNKELISLLNSRLSVLDQDNPILAQLPGLYTILPGLEPQASLPSKTKSLNIPNASLRIDRATFAVIDPLVSSPSEFCVNSLQVNFRKERLELIHFSSSHPSSMSQTSLRDKFPRLVKKMSTTISLGEVTLVVFPHLMSFAQHVLRVRRQYAHKLGDFGKSAASDGFTISSKTSGLSNVIITVSLRRLRIRAAAENLVFEFGVVGLQTSSAQLSAHGNGDQSMNHSIIFEETYLQARSRSHPDKESDQDILAALTFDHGRASGLSKDESPGSKSTYRLVFSISQMRLNVPRSVLRLYRFVEEWRADFLPGIETTMKAMLSEMRSRPAQTASPDPSISPRNLVFHVNGVVTQVGIALQVMHGTWLTWEANNAVAYAKSPLTSMSTSTHTFGVQISSVILNISSKPNVRDAAPSSRVRLVLPPLSVAGRYDGNRIHALTLVDFIELKVKPSHSDTLLAVQQKFGQDFNDLLSLMQETRRKQVVPSAQKRATNKRVLLYGGFIKMKGFRIGLEGLSSTFYFECLDIGGGINNANGLSWDIGLTGLALSLAPRTLGGLTYNPAHRSAFVTIDFKVMGADKADSDILVKHLDLSISRIHAVMQASSIGEVGDFIDHLQAEMLDRQEQRSIELAAFKEKTQKILKTFDVKVRDVQLEETTSWLGGYIVNVSIQNIGVAFPLTHNHELELWRTRPRDSTTIRAFLFSIRSIAFNTNRGETGQAVMQSLSLQFVSRFRQSHPEDFSAEKHQTQNRLVYPEMKAVLRSSTSAASRKIWIDASVDGFILDLDSTIPDYVFSLIDVYRQGKERVERLSTSAPRTPSSAAPTIDESKPSFDKHYTAIPTSNVFAALTFLSGKVRVYSGSAIKQLRTRSLSNGFQELTDEQIHDVGAEVFNLPVVSVWAEYRATPASQKMSGDRDLEPSLLMFKSTVHSSRNTLRPKLLPFITELVHHIEVRMRKISARPSLPPTLPTPSVANVSRPSPSLIDDVESASVSSMQLSFSLRIDKSNLELTCQPDVNVVAGLHWESGGFIVNVSPGARKVSFTGTVGGLTIGLKHGFLSEDCVNLDARNLTFSVSFSKMDSGSGRWVNSISVVLDTEFLGGVRFSRLQDVLCFKAVWLDRIPIFNNYAPVETKNPSNATLAVSTPIDPQPKQGFSTAILVRIRQIKVSVDLGQSISFTVMDLKDAVLRSNLTEPLNEVSVFVGEMTVSAKGNLSGHLHVPNCFFQTIRRSESYLIEDGAQSCMLALNLTSGPLVAVLESDHQRLLHYRAEPLKVEIFDDWSITVARTDSKAKSLQLSFTVNSPEVVMVVTVGTIPKIMSYVNKFKSNLDAQRHGASRESKTYWATRTPKPENPLSAVAEAMLHSARTRFKEAETSLSYIITQHMSLRLDLLRLVVFPRSMNDVEIAQFIGQDVRARLDRLVASETQPAKRDLHLSFLSMTISKHTHNHPALVPPNPLEGFDGREWLLAMFKDATDATIVGLPSMKMHMISEEVLQETTRELLYNFRSEFIRKEGMQAFEDIYITLNMSLYAWLTVLRKNLTREMDQVQATEDWRTSITAAAAGGSSSISGTGSVRKKVPEPLIIPSDTSKSATPPSSGSGLVASPMYLSPTVGPASVRYPSLDQATRSASFQNPRSASSIRDSSTPPFLSPVSFPTSARDTAVSGDVSPAPSGISVGTASAQGTSSSGKRTLIAYKPRERHIERLTMRQLGEATPDVMHPFFMKKAGFNLEDSLPQYVHEYATVPLEEIMDLLLRLYSQQLLRKGEGEGGGDTISSSSPNL